MNFSKPSIIFLSWLGVSSAAGAGVYFSSNIFSVEKFYGKIIFSKVTFSASQKSDSSSGDKSFYMARLLTNEEYNKEQTKISKTSAVSEDNDVEKNIDDSIFFDISYPINKEAAWKILIDIEFRTLEEVKTTIREKLEDLKKVFSDKTIKEIKDKFNLT